MKISRRVLATLVLAALPFTASAQSDRQLKLIVGFPPGTGPDIVARGVAQKMGEALKQSIVVDNRAGAGGQIAAQAVAKSPPDGTTLLLGEVGSISIAPAAYGKLPYDPAKELVAVSEVVQSDFVLVVPATATAKDVKTFVANAKAQSNRLNFATFGAGTPGHFGAEIFAQQGGFKIEPIHYRATGDAITALAAGDVQGGFMTTALASAQIKGGKLRALGTTARARSPLMPDVPTFAESGMPEVNFSAWFALFAPAKTSSAQLDALNAAAMSAMQNPEIKKTLQDAGFTVLGTSRADAERMVASEAQRWGGVVKATGFKAD